MQALGAIRSRAMEAPTATAGVINPDVGGSNPPPLPGMTDVTGPVAATEHLARSHLLEGVLVHCTVFEKWFQPFDELGWLCGVA